MHQHTGLKVKHTLPFFPLTNQLKQVGDANVTGLRRPVTVASLLTAVTWTPFA